LSIVNLFWRQVIIQIQLVTSTPHNLKKIRKKNQ
jgi:hypothetical protein